MWGLQALQLPVDAHLQGALVTSLQRRLPLMNAMHAASVAYALTELEMQFGGRLRKTLCDALLCTSGDMGAHGVTYVLRCIAKRKWQLEGRLRDALLRADERESTRISDQEVANTLWVLVSLRLMPTAELRANLLGAAQRESARMNPQDVANTLSALATMQLQLDAELQAALLDAGQSESAGMIPQAVGTGQAPDRARRAAARCSARGGAPRECAALLPSPPFLALFLWAQRPIKLCSQAWSAADQQAVLSAGASGRIHPVLSLYITH